jgi:para-nitrobenzyl esterase
MRRTSLLSCLVVCAAAACGSAPVSEGLEITTTQGAVRGLARKGARHFLGIPYAAPPVGELRWKAPRPAAAWSGVRDATERGPACAQNGLTGETYDPATSEDCLTVNVWTPEVVREPLPVMVWLHGGGFILGSGGDPTFDGAILASTQDVVIVTVNYRLGPFGFLRHPALTVEDPAHPTSGNLGLEDQRLALEWVRDNARAFGGDPSRVTLFGESAGAISTCIHLVSPASRGLFARAIVESGPCSMAPFTSAADAEAQGQTLARALGCDGAGDGARDDAAVRACLRSKSTAAVQNALKAKEAIVVGSGVSWFPVVDGVVLPERPGALLARGESAPVPLIVGANADEGTLFLALGAKIETEEDARGALGSQLTPAQVDRLAMRYPFASNPKLAFTQGLGDFFVCDARRLARAQAATGQPTFLYHFTRAFDFLYPNLGAFHSAEIPFVWGNPYVVFELKDEERPLSAAMQTYWTRFARAGDPNAGAAAGAVAWPRYQATTDRHLQLDLTIAPGEHLRSDACDFFDSLF